MGGEGGSTKYSRKGKLNEKNSCTPINPKKIFMLWPKQNSYKEFDNEKKFLQLENSSLPVRVRCHGWHGWTWVETWKSWAIV